MTILEAHEADQTAPIVGTTDECTKHYVGASGVAQIPDTLHGKFCDFAARVQDVEFGFVVQLKSAAAPTAWTFAAPSTFASPARVGGILKAAGPEKRRKIPQPETIMHTVYLVYVGATAAAELYVTPSQGVGAY